MDANPSDRTKPARTVKQRVNAAVRLSGKCFVPVRVSIDRINVHLRGWSNYFGRGYPRKSFRQINWFVQERLQRHLRRRSQRPYRLRDKMSWYAQLQHLGLQSL